MELFHMTRYVSDEDEEMKENESQPELLLHQLNSKTQQPQLQPLEQKKRKKRKKKQSGKKTDKNDRSPESGFTILGHDSQKGKNFQVKAVLPNWLQSPIYISNEGSENIHEILQNDYLERKCSENQIQSFFPVQKTLIPILLESFSFSKFYPPRDVAVSAPTGSGKTLAFVLPLLKVLCDSSSIPEIRAIVLLPTQSLALQIYSVFQTYVFPEIKVGLAVGGSKSLSQEQSSFVKKVMDETYISCIHILVATPGRLVDHIQKTPGFSLKALRFLILDEADRLMTDFQNDWLTILENFVFKERERMGRINVYNINKRPLPLSKILFSATLSSNPENLEKLHLYEPLYFVTSRKSSHSFSTPKGLEEKIVLVSTGMRKPLVLDYLLRKPQFSRSLVFTKSSSSAKSLSVLLNTLGHDAVPISSQVEKRNSVLSKFRREEIKVLVTTDALARGLDIDGTLTVISYDIPTYVETYIHRVGRTARGGSSGLAVTLLEPQQVQHFKKLMRDVSRNTDEDLEEILVNESEFDLEAYETFRAKASEILSNKSKKSKK